MPQPFSDRCRIWLGLPREPRHFYDLFGLEFGEADPARIAAAARRTQEKVDQVPDAERTDEWRSLAQQIQLAHQTLTTESLKNAYDTELNSKGADKPASPRIDLGLGPTEKRFTIGALSGVPGGGKTPRTLGPLSIQAAPGKAPAASRVEEQPSTTVPDAPRETAGPRISLQGVSSLPPSWKRGTPAPQDQPAFPPAKPSSTQKPTAPAKPISVALPISVVPPKTPPQTPPAPTKPSATKPASAPAKPISVVPPKTPPTPNKTAAATPTSSATRERSAPAKLEIRIPAAPQIPATSAAQDPTIVPPPPAPSTEPVVPSVPRRRAPRPRPKTAPLPWWATLMGLVAFATVMGSLYWAVQHWMKPRQAARAQVPKAEPSDASELPLPEVKPRPAPKPVAPPTAPPAPEKQPEAVTEPKPQPMPEPMPPADTPPVMDGPGADMVREPDSVDPAPADAPAMKPEAAPDDPPPASATATDANAAPDDMRPQEAPRELGSDVQRQVLSKLKLARRAIVERRLEEARKSLEAANELALGSTLEPQVTRLSLIADHVDQFWQAFEEGLKDLGGQEITLGGKLASVIEVRPKELLVRIEGRNRKFNRERLPTGIAIAVADRALKPDAGSSDVFRGAYLAVQPSPDRAKVMAEWKKAQEKGVPVDELLPFLDDRYETPTPRRSRARDTEAADDAGDE